MNDERQRLFHLFHDLVDEALEQYDAGYAVDLENRYYELADTLIAEHISTEQQLAQARALLHEAREVVWIAEGATPLTDKIRAFLAQHKEPNP